MLRRSVCSLWLGVLLCGLAATGWAASDAKGVRVVIDKPRPGQVVRSQVDLALLSGVALPGSRPSRFDVMVVLDVSGSTEHPSGMDVNQNGKVGVPADSLAVYGDSVRNTDPGDSILAAEARAAYVLLDSLDSERVRVGLVSFSGDYREDGKRQNLGQSAEADALLEQALTHDYDAVRRRLGMVVARGSYGGTNFEAGIKKALRELVGLDGAQSRHDPRSRKVMLMLTDGKPSLPFGAVNFEDEGDIEAAIAAAELAHHGRVCINVYGLGEFAFDYPFAATEVARVTGGAYTPVRRPGDIVTLLSAVSFANVDDVIAVNLTMGQMSGPNDVEIQPDGSFRGFVPVQPGSNRIRVSALASDGSRGSAEVEITVRSQVRTDAELEAERGRIRQRNRDLQLLVERRRQEAFRKAERDRMLQIEVEEDGSAEEAL